MPKVIVAGGGLAGMAAGVALASAGYEVDLYESRPYLGGRATSYTIPTGDGGSLTIDNCQHILLRCCVNLLDFYTRLGVMDQIEFHREFYFVEPGGRTSVFKAGALPKPLHFTEAFLKMRFLSFSEKAALIRGLLALQREYGRRGDLDRITMADWLHEKHQPPRVVDRFWRQVLVSAINEELDRMAARWGFQVFWLGFLAKSDSYHMGVPLRGLGPLYDLGSRVRVHLRSPVREITSAGIRLESSAATGDYYVNALPFDSRAIAASPITGVHLWFDRKVTALPHATLLERTIQWMFNKDSGQYLQLLVSASRSTMPMERQAVVDLMVRELGEYFPEVRTAKLVRSHVVKEVRATFSAIPGLQRLSSETTEPNVFRASDAVATGWPSTMEGAVRSGYLAAEAITKRAGSPVRFVVPDIA